MNHALLIAALTLATGCRGFIDNQAAASTYRILERSQQAARRLPDLELAREAMPGGILQLEAFALAYPAHAGFKRLHAEAVCQYAVGFVFDDWEAARLAGTADVDRLAARVVGLLTMCADVNLALLPPAWRAARAGGADAWNAMIATSTRAQLAPMLWIATTDAVVLAIDPLRGVARLGMITTTLERCVALEPGFHGADAELLLGTLAAGRSQFLGGADGEAWFAQARAGAGEGALLVDVMFARGTLVARQDRDQFERTLRAVLAADVTRWPERRLTNELARRKAARYLAAIDRLIPADRR